MKTTVSAILTELCERYPAFCPMKGDVEAAFTLLANALRGGGKLLFCGNGGSAADSEHLAGELLKSFKKARPIGDDMKAALAAYPHGSEIATALEAGLKVISLISHPAFATAYGNDRDPAFTFAQQLFVLGDAGDVLVAFSTSGNSRNCVLAAETAKAKGLRVLSLTGARESELSKLSDVALRVPETETFKVQELHLPLYHALAAMLEEEFF